MEQRDPTNRISNIGANLAVIMMFVITIHILLEIILRAFFSSSTYVLDEFVGYGTATLTFFSLAYGLKEGALIRVEILQTALPDSLRSVIELFSIIVTFTAFSFLAWFIYLGVYRNFVRGAVSESVAEIPLWIPEGLVLLGNIVFLIALVGRGIQVFRGHDPNKNKIGSM